MADRIKGITIELDGDTTKLSTALKGVNKEIRDTQSNLKDVDKLLKMDPGNADLLSQKQKYLTDSIDATKKKLEEEKLALEQLKNAPQTEETQRQQEALTREIEATKQSLKGLTDEYEQFGSVSSQQLQNAGAKMQEVGGKISGAGEKLMPVTAAITGVGAASVAASTNFEQSFAQLSTIADTNEVTADELKRQIMDVSNQYGVSASDIAESTYSAISAGRSTSEAVDFVATATQAAKAGFTDSGTAIDTLTTIMNAYGDSAGTATEISDRLLTTQNMGKTTFAELGSSMGKVIPTAAMYGVNLDNLASAYVATTKNGIATAESTTYINGMLNELGKSGSKASTILQEETGKSFKELMDSGMSLSDVIGIVADHAEKSGLSIADCFGSAEAAKAAATISQHAEDFDSALAQMGQSAGTTADAFEKMDETSGASMEKMKVAIENAGIAIGSALAPTVTAVAETITNLAKAFSGLDPGMQKVFVTIAALVAALGPTLIFAGKIISAVGTVTSAVGKLKGILEAGTLVTKVTASFGSLGTMLSGIGTTIGGVLTAAAPFIPWILAAIAAIAAIILIVKNWGAISEWFKGVWEAVCTGVQEFGQGLAEFFSGLWEGIKSTIETVWNGISSFFSTLWNGIKDTASTIWNGVKDFFSGIWEGIKGAASTAWDGIKSGLSTAWEGIKSTASTTFTTIKDGIGTAWENVKSATSEKWETIKSTINEKGGGIKGVISTALEGYKSLWTGAFDVINQLTGGKLGDALSSARDKLGQIKDTFSNIMEGAKNIVSGALDRIKSFFSNCHLELPHIKLPHFSISGSFSLNPPSIPHIGVDWYRKAMDDAYILNSPTIFGMSGGKMLGGGEAGPEAIVGTDKLAEIVQSAIAGMGGGTTVIPVYIGQDRIDEIVVKATQRNQFRSGRR